MEKKPYVQIVNKPILRQLSYVTHQLEEYICTTSFWTTFGTTISPFFWKKNKREKYGDR